MRRYRSEPFASVAVSALATKLIRMEELLARAEARRLAAQPEHATAREEKLGQFFTPVAVAKLLAALPHVPERDEISILDPGAGTGTLSTALIDRLLFERPSLRIRLVAVEVDETLLPALRATLADCESRGVETTLITDDFVAWALSTPERFDLVIQNPPYNKLRSGSTTDHVLKGVGIRVPNIYAGFVALGIRLLRDDGQQVSITPRSWMNGTYYAPFRHDFLGRAGIDAIHIFESRSTVFGDSGVLQETVIVSATKGHKPERVRILISGDQRDEAQERAVPYTDVATADFIHIPATQHDADAVKWMARFTDTFDSLGLSVSTGKVVDFRSRELLFHEWEQDAVPMIYPANFHDGNIEHPRESVHKPQWFRVSPELAHKYLVPGGTYTLIKRFSAKEEKRRVVSAVWSGAGPVAFDNKTNYIHDHGRGLDPVLARGLCMWFNSTRLDDYFRVFSGHTQVNAGDLRQMRLPSFDQLIALGESALPPDEAVEKVIARERTPITV